MVEHNHREYVEGCYRCELGRDEVAFMAKYIDPEDDEYDVALGDDRCITMPDGSCVGKGCMHDLRVDWLAREVRAAQKQRESGKRRASPRSKRPWEADR